MLPQVRRENDNAIVLLDTLQQVVDLLIRVAIPGVVDVGSFAKQRLRFIEEQNPVLAGRATDNDQDRNTPSDLPPWLYFARSGVGPIARPDFIEILQVLVR